MRVFLDTNVVASAVATRGLCADVLREVLSSHELIISQQLLAELLDVLQRKFGVPQPLADEVIRMLRQDTYLSTPGNLPELKIKDKDDLLILSAALSGNADVLVTGDKELLALEKAGGLKIISPRAFWEGLNK